MTQYSVREIVHNYTPSFSLETPIRHAAAVLVDANAAAAPVLDAEGRLIGILTQKDCFRPALHASYHHEWTGTVGDLMTRTVVTVDIDEEVIRAAEMFLEHPHRVFPAMRGTEVAGLLHRSDVLALLMRLG